LCDDVRDRNQFQGNGTADYDPLFRVISEEEIPWIVNRFVHFGFEAGINQDGTRLGWRQTMDLNGCGVPTCELVTKKTPRRQYNEKDNNRNSLDEHE
jgi:hypothetical protein